MAYVGWDVRNIPMVLVLIVVRRLVRCFDHVTYGGRTALENELILGCRAAYATLGGRIKWLGEDIQDFLPILREVVLYPVKDVDIFTVRLLLGQVLMVLRDQVLESWALYVPTFLLQKEMSARSIKVTQDLTVLLIA
jgi:hypothetical protein